MTDKWQNCYDEGWQGLIVPEAFSHPAKFSRGLIHRIYEHAKEMGWFKPGDYCLDPFGGVSLGALDALGMGLNWIGVELEEKFVKLGQQNIDLWNRQLKGWPNLGTARIVQGDSRRLGECIEGILRCCTSRLGHPNTEENSVRTSDLNTSLIISSPPFTDAGAGDKRRYGGIKDPSRLHSATYYLGGISDYGHTPGNLANMREGDIDLVVGSPPYVEAITRERPTGDNKIMKEKVIHANYGQSPGQLGSMSEGSFDMCVSSPPYEASMSSEKTGIDWSKGKRKDGTPRDKSKEKSFGRSVAGSPGAELMYSKLDNNLGNSSGDTFWSANKEIISQCYDLLKPNGMSIWVCKDYIKAGKRVPFSDRWLALCESVGFKLVCRHQAMLVKEHGTQTTIHGDEKITTERKSFFRRLAESKGSPRIDNEDVLCLVKE